MVGKKRAFVGLSECRGRALYIIKCAFVGLSVAFDSCISVNNHAAHHCGRLQRRTPSRRRVHSRDEQGRTDVHTARHGKRMQHTNEPKHPNMEKRSPDHETDTRVGSSSASLWLSGRVRPCLCLELLVDLRLIGYGSPATRRFPSVVGVPCRSYGFRT